MDFPASNHPFKKETHGTGTHYFIFIYFYGFSVFFQTTSASTRKAVSKIVPWLVVRCFIWKVAWANLKFAHSLPSFLLFSFLFLSFPYAISFPLFSSIIYKDNIISLFLRTKLQTGKPVEIKWLSALNWKCTRKEGSWTWAPQLFILLFSDTENNQTKTPWSWYQAPYAPWKTTYCMQAERWSEGLGVTRAKERRAGRQQDANLTLKELFKLVFIQSFGFSILCS